MDMNEDKNEVTMTGHVHHVHGSMKENFEGHGKEMKGHMHKMMNMQSHSATVICIFSFPIYFYKKKKNISLKLYMYMYI